MAGVAEKLRALKAFEVPAVIATETDESVSVGESVSIPSAQLRIVQNPSVIWSDLVTCG